MKLTARIRMQLSLAPILVFLMAAPSVIAQTPPPAP
jgi:hypothetical protein